MAKKKKNIYIVLLREVVGLVASIPLTLAFGLALLLAGVSGLILLGEVAHMVSPKLLFEMPTQFIVWWSKSLAHMLATFLGSLVFIFMFLRFTSRK